MVSWTQRAPDDSVHLSLEHGQKKLSLDFEVLFSPAQPHLCCGRQNVFGAEDELRVESESVDKTLEFPDKQLLPPETGEELAGAGKEMWPIMHCIIQRRAFISPSRSFTSPMRVLDTETGQFVGIDPEATDEYGDPKTPVYAILSHTWDETGEQTYQELKKIQKRYKFTSRIPVLRIPPGGTLARLRELPSKMLRHAIWHHGNLSPKIRDACRIARGNGYRYLWIDSCCIDKSSSSELSEAINSMYKWYGLARVCYAYLADVPHGEDHHAMGSAFRESRWFRRGWTLQELIAPLSVEFLSKDWEPIGSKHTVVNLVESVTKIDHEALLHWVPLDTFSVAQRLSWAANRMTTRVEDRAYSLLGIFNINMPTLYGEGAHAFRRLQEQIMQRTPDQSLFAWGDVYPSSQLSQDPDLTNTPKAHHALLRILDQRRHLFSSSPDSFKGCEGIRISRHGASQLLSSNGHKLAYTPTPYGISTQFLMAPLTRNLLLGAIPHSTEDFQLDTSESLEGSQWYLVILQCELGEHQGHCLGRVCYLTPSEESDINYVYTGYICIVSRQGETLGWADLFHLSPETIEHFRPQTKLKTVYIPHPDRATLSASSNLRSQPYTTIKLALLRATRGALRSQGYSADLRDPDPDHPTTHWLTLSKDEHTITVQFQHTLKDDGDQFTIEAEVKMSGSHVRLDSAPDLYQAESHTVSWWDRIGLVGWDTKLDHEKVRLSAAGAGTLTIDLGLDFGGHGVYFLRVDVLSDVPPASSAVEPAVDQEEEGESTEAGSQPGELNAELCWLGEYGGDMWRGDRAEY
ncbi:hypothetical protein V8D89_000332 [Ganoderma adspersum]